MRFRAVTLVLVFLASLVAKGALPPNYHDGIVLVAFYPWVGAADQARILAGVGGHDIKTVGAGTHIVFVGSGRVEAAISALKLPGQIRYAEPDFTHELAGGTIPNDTFAGNQWALTDAAETSAWRVTTGGNAVVIAELDTGVQYSHPDLLSNIWNNPGGIGGCAAGTHGYNVLSGTCDPMDDDADYDGHGTHVAGIMGAVGNNRAGTAGVNWTTSIMPVKWVNGSNTGFTSDLITAIDWVVQVKKAGVNVRVVNDSATWAGTPSSQALSDAIDLLGSNDILFVAAAGNTAQNNDTIPRYPCSYDRPNMICVGASDQNDQLWSSSNYGVATVKLAAPGVNIYSTLRQSNYGYISGGSMAAPQVSGTAALILSEGYMSVSALRADILNSIDPIPALQGLVATGGRLNVCKAVPGCASGTQMVPASVSAPVITGQTQMGSVLGASTGVWSGLPAAYAYQWYRCVASSPCSAINGATGPNYSPLGSSDVGAGLMVAVSASNANGSTLAWSTVSSAIRAVASPFSITSTIQDGAVVSGTMKWSATTATQVNFVQFYVDGVLAQTVTSAPFDYNVSTTDLLDTSTLGNGRHVLGIRALASDNRTYGFYGATVSVQSTPFNTSLPVVSGSAVQGQTLSTTTGTWTNSPTSFTYQWDRCGTGGTNCSVIAGANSAQYTVSSSDVGFALRSAVTAANASGSTAAFSALTATVPGSGAPGGGIALVQSNAAQGTGVASLSAGFSGNNQAGDLIIAVVRMSSTSQTVAVSDTLGNVYTEAVSQVQSSDGHQLHLFYAGNIARGANSVTAVFSASNNHPWLAVYEYSGVNALDQTGRAQGYGVSANAGAVSTTAANELVFAAVGLPAFYGGAVTAGSGYALQQQDTNVSRAATEAAVVTSSGTFQGIFGFNSAANWTAVIATFKAGGNTTPPPPSSIALLQSNAAGGTALSSLSSGFNQSNQAHNMILAVVRMSTTWQTVTVSDSSGNAYALASSQAQSSDGHQLLLFYAKNIVGGPNTVTATFSGINNHPWLAVFEYKGLNITAPLDQTAHAQGSGSTVDSGATSITSSANALVFSATGLPASYTGVVIPASGYTFQQQNTASSRAATESMTVNSTGAFHGVFNLNAAANWTAVTAVFKP
jgi:subtilisin family serine protease